MKNCNTPSLIAIALILVGIYAWLVHDGLPFFGELFAWIGIIAPLVGFGFLLFGIIRYFFD